MNILFVHERPSYFGGAEQNIADSVKALRRDGIKCHLAFSPKFPSNLEFFQLFDSQHACHEMDECESNISTSTLSVIASRVSADCLYLHKMKTLPESIAFIDCHKVQMVHDHDLCCPRRHKYFAVSEHVCERAAGLRCYLDAAFVTADSKKLLGISYSSISDKLQEMRRRRSLDAFVVASNFMRDELIQNGFEEARVLVLPLGVRRQALPTAVPSSSIPTVLFIGQLVRGKGADLLLRALAQITSPFSAVIVGKGNAEDSLRTLCAKLDLVGQVEFRGWLNHEQLSSVYVGARVVAFPARWPEPFGLVGIEAMRHGRPVVAFDVGGISDWLQHGRTGFLVPEQDITAFADALQRLLADHTLAQTMGDAGLSASSELFSFDGYIAKLKAILLPRNALRNRTLHSYEEPGAKCPLTSIRTFLPGK